jgi:hypothetical protein
MIGLGLAMLLGFRPALVIAAVFNSVWLLDQLLSWRRRDPARPRRTARPRPLPHALLSVVSLAAAVVAWVAVAVVHVSAA